MTKALILIEDKGYLPYFHHKPPYKGKMIFRANHPLGQWKKVYVFEDE